MLDDDLLKNLNAIQLRNGLAPSATLASGDFTIEMETGTGKTYVYLRTIFELYKRSDSPSSSLWCPPVAIKEGVYKSLQIMEEHFRALYANTPFEYFLYDSAKLGSVRNFATSPHIQIMVVTVGAINKKEVNNLYKDSEKTGGETPIDLIRATKPVLIVDEPQSVDGGIEGRGRRRWLRCTPCVRCGTQRPTSTSTTWSTGWTPWMLMSRSWSSKLRLPPPPSRMRTIHRTCV